MSRPQRERERSIAGGESRRPFVAGGLNSGEGNHRVGTGGKIFRQRFGQGKRFGKIRGRLGTVSQSPGGFAQPEQGLDQYQAAHVDRASFRARSRATAKSALAPRRSRF